QPTGKLYEAFFATAFHAHPTRNPVIGWMSDLENMTYLDAQEWYRNWYTPQNAIVVIVGDVDPEQVVQWAKESYAKVPAKFLPERKPQDEPEQMGTRRVQVKAPAENPYIVLGFKVPKVENVETDVDPYALEVLSAVLDGYAGARLGRDLVQEQKIATQASAGYDGTGRGPSLFYLGATPAQGKTVEDMEAALLEQLNRVATEGVTEEELKRVKAQLVASQVYKRDSIYGQAMEIGQHVTIGFEVADIDRMIEKIRQVTVEQVQAVAGKYFNTDKMTVGTLYPLPLDPAQQAKRPSGLMH
ncbi:MAG: pitrilysin family protein, partial [Limnobacter sp.]|nr:pitrilysin family protein [Limnobacter sp.]